MFWYVAYSWRNPTLHLSKGYLTGQGIWACQIGRIVLSTDRIYCWKNPCTRYYCLNSERNCSLLSFLRTRKCWFPQVSVFDQLGMGSFSSYLFLERHTHQYHSLHCHSLSRLSHRYIYLSQAQIVFFTRLKSFQVVKAAGLKYIRAVVKRVIFRPVNF